MIGTRTRRTASWPAARRRRHAGAVVALVALVAFAASGCVGKTGRNDDYVAPGSGGGPSGNVVPHDG